MSKVLFIGCLHFGHSSVARYRGFIDSYQHDDYLIENYNSVVNKKDIVYILGDITMETPEYYYQLDRLNGRKKVILGNHDRGKDVPELLNYVETVEAMCNYKGFVLTHCPIHPNEIGFYRGNIHAHIHHRNKLQELSVKYKYGDGGLLTQEPTLYKYHNVDAHLLGYKPICIEDILNKNI